MKTSDINSGVFILDKKSFKKVMKWVIGKLKWVRWKVG